MWESIKYVSGIFTLVAFVVAVFSGVLRTAIRRKERLILAAQEGERAALVKDALEFFHVDTANLSPKDQFKVVMEQIKARDRRHARIIKTVVILALICACLAGYAISKTSNAVVLPTLTSAKATADQAGRYIVDLTWENGQIAGGTLYWELLPGEPPAGDLPFQRTRSEELPKDRNFKSFSPKIELSAKPYGRFVIVQPDGNETKGHVESIVMSASLPKKD